MQAKYFNISLIIVIIIAFLVFYFFLMPIKINNFYLAISSDKFIEFDYNISIIFLICNTLIIISFLAFITISIIWLCKFFLQEKANEHQIKINEEQNKLIREGRHTPEVRKYLEYAEILSKTIDKFKDIKKYKEEDLEKIVSALTNIKEFKENN